MVAILDPAAVDSLEWVHKEALVGFAMFVLLATTSTKVVPVHDVAQKCNVPISN